MARPKPLLELSLHIIPEVSFPDHTILGRPDLVGTTSQHGRDSSTLLWPYLLFIPLSPKDIGIISCLYLLPGDPTYIAHTDQNSFVFVSLKLNFLKCVRCSFIFVILCGLFLWRHYKFLGRRYWRLKLLTFANYTVRRKPYIIPHPHHSIYVVFWYIHTMVENFSIFLGIHFSLKDYVFFCCQDLQHISLN